MDKRLLKLAFKSIKRRWKEIGRACLATFLSVFFVTAILIFEENMFEWQIASNKDRFGNWFLMEANTSKQSEYLMNYRDFVEYASVYSAVKLYDEEFQFAECYVGYMTPEFIEIGCLETTNGELPKENNEIAMDWNTLAKLGISSPKVGQTITIRYYEKNAEQEQDKQRTEEFILTGIIEDYTNVWRDGHYLPGAVVSKMRYDAFNYQALSTHIYKLRKMDRDTDFGEIYTAINDEVRLNPIYNSYVYDYKPWGTQSVYDYIYFLVMIIGISALTYQLLVYKSSRKKAYGLMGNLGASKLQIVCIAFIENVVMLVPAGVMGIVMASIAGKIVCAIIEFKMGIDFYTMEIVVLGKGLFAITIAVIIVELADKLLALRPVALKKKVPLTQKYKIKDKFNRKNVLTKISFRFTQSNKLIQNIGIRVFSLTVCVVIIICFVKIYQAQEAYYANKDNLDFIGTAYEDCDYRLGVPYYVRVTADVKDEDDKDDGRVYFSMVSKFASGKEEPFDYQYNPTATEIQNLIDNSGSSFSFDNSYTILQVSDNEAIAHVNMTVSDGRFVKESDTNITKGLTEIELNTIKNVTGVREVSYGAYENQRAWSWEGMSVEKMGFNRLIMEKTSSSHSPLTYSNRYLFATQYVKSTKELYDKLTKYIDEDMIDYEAFCKGEQVIVFLEDNPYGDYDNTLRPGTTLNYHYYDLPYLRSDFFGKTEASSVFSYDESYMELTKGWVYQCEKYDNGGSFWWLDEKGQKEENRKLITRTVIEPCIQTKAVGVVILTDEIKKDLKSIISCDSYYTAIASDELAKRACEKQNKLMTELAGVKELPQECRAEVKYNQVLIKYDLSASVCATDNIISTFCEENDIRYVSFSDVNEKYRTELINAYLRYGITILAVLVINILIVAVVANNRLDSRRQRIELLMRLGASKIDVCRIFMTEAIRESLWCVFSLPMVLVTQYLIYRKNV